MTPSGVIRLFISLLFASFLVSCGGGGGGGGGGNNSGSSNWDTMVWDQDNWS